MKNNYLMLKTLSFNEKSTAGISVPDDARISIPDNTPTSAAAPVFLSEKNYVEERITNIFLTIGIPASLNGFHFLREAVKMAVGNYKMVCSITKELYPKVAVRFDTSPYKVERGIRHAIEVAWNKGKIVNINSIFGLRVYETNEKPSNGEFIALLADKMLLESV